MYPYPSLQARPTCHRTLPHYHLNQPPSLHTTTHSLLINPPRLQQTLASQTEDFHEIYSGNYQLHRGSGVHIDSATPMVSVLRNLSRTTVPVHDHRQHNILPHPSPHTPAINLPQNTPRLSLPIISPSPHAHPAEVPTPPRPPARSSFPSGRKLAIILSHLPPISTSPLHNHHHLSPSLPISQPPPLPPQSQHLPIHSSHPLLISIHHHPEPDLSLPRSQHPCQNELNTTQQHPSDNSTDTDARMAQLLLRWGLVSKVGYRVALFKPGWGRGMGWGSSGISCRDSRMGR